ncbi:MAG: sugar ABC transporter permease [Gammaproteobacteria bacterium]|nr:MAG: sugar ABC transporter permease [Gammaproteobacteria bacterium]
MAQHVAPELPKVTVKPRRSGLTNEQRTTILGYALVAPVVICLLILVVYPFFFAIWISFTDRMIGQPGKFVGLGNYAYLIRQPDFQATVRNTIVLVGSVQTLKLVFGLGIALLLNQQIRARQFWRGLILLPWAMPGFVAFITWKLLFHPQAGALNHILISLGLVQTHVDFLSTKALAMPSVILASFWRGFPFWVITFLAGLQTVPNELYEAAAIDGADAWRRFRHVTLPGIRHVILVVVLLSTIWTTNSFEAVWLMTQGGPSNATMTFPVLAYFGLQSLRIGEAAAVAVSLIPIFALLAMIVAKMLQEQD